MRRLLVSTWHEGDLVVAQCLDVDIASQGKTVPEALANLREAVELFFETASRSEIESRLREGIEVSQLEVSVG